MTDDGIAAAWSTHNAILLKLLDAIPEGGLADALAPRGRTVGSHLAHAHNVRLMWLKVSTPDLAGCAAKLDADRMDRASLREAIAASGAAMAELFARAVSSGKLKGFKGTAAAFLGYFVAHEWYHVGKADLILRQAGHAPDDKIHYALWEDWSRL